MDGKGNALTETKKQQQVQDKAWPTESELISF